MLHASGPRRPFETRLHGPVVHAHSALGRLVPFRAHGVAEFGPVGMAALRVIGAALLPMLKLRGQLGELRRHWRSIFVVGVMNSALPFLYFVYAALPTTAGLSVISAALVLVVALVLWWPASAPSGVAWLTDALLRCCVPARPTCCTYG